MHVSGHASAIVRVQSPVADEQGTPGVGPNANWVDAQKELSHELVGVGYPNPFTSVRSEQVGVAAGGGGVATQLEV